MIEIIVALSLAFGGGVYAGDSYCDSKHQKIEEAIEETRKASQQAAAEEIAKIRVENTTIENKVIEQVRVEKVYSECKHSPDSWKAIQSAFH